MVSFFFFSRMSGPKGRGGEGEGPLFHEQWSQVECATWYLANGKVDPLWYAFYNLTHLAKITVVTARFSDKSGWHICTLSSWISWAFVKKHWGKHKCSNFHSLVVWSQVALSSCSACACMDACMCVFLIICWDFVWVDIWEIIWASNLSLCWPV